MITQRRGFYIAPKILRHIFQKKKNILIIAHLKAGMVRNDLKWFSPSAAKIGSTSMSADESVKYLAV